MRTAIASALALSLAAGGAAAQRAVDAPRSGTGVDAPRAIQTPRGGIDRPSGRVLDAPGDRTTGRAVPPAATVPSDGERNTVEESLQQAEEALERSERVLQETDAAPASE